MLHTQDAAERNASSPPPLALELRDVTVSYGGIVALDGVSLAIPRGTVSGLIGPNGAGKTTLFDVISGVCRPDRGRVFLDGEDVTSASVPTRCRRGAHRTYQRVQTFAWLSVTDNVLAALEWRGGGGGVLADLVRTPSRRRTEAERRARVADVLEQCGLTERRDEPAGSLPIGLSRMVEFARAIVDPPRLLLLDEPTSGLQESEAAELAAGIRNVVADTGCAVVVIEHDMPFVMANCDPVFVLERGRMLFTGTPAEVQVSKEVHVAYLGERRNRDADSSIATP